jgi:hypothetical protein
MATGFDRSNAILETIEAFVRAIEARIHFGETPVDVIEQVIEARIHVGETPVDVIEQAIEATIHVAAQSLNFSVDGLDLRLESGMVVRGGVTDVENGRHQIGVGVVVHATILHVRCYRDVPLDRGRQLGGFWVRDMDRLAVHRFGRVHDRFGERRMRMDRETDIFDRGAHFERDQAFADQ